MGKAQQRTVLWYLVFIGFAVNYMIRINLNITIVEMVKQRPGSASNQRRILSECLIGGSDGINDRDWRNDSVQIVLCSNVHGTPCDGRENTSTMESTPNPFLKKDKIFTFERSMLNTLNWLIVLNVIVAEFLGLIFIGFQRRI